MNKISSFLYQLPGFTISDFCAMELDNMTIFISMMQHYLSMDTKEQTKRNFYKLFSDIPAINRDNYGYFFFEFSINNILLYGKFIFPKPQELINYYKWVLDLADRFEIVYKQNKNRMSKYRYPKTSERDRKFEIFANEGNSNNNLNKNTEEDFDEKEFNKTIEEIQEINFSSKKPYNLKNKYVFKEMINAIPNTKSILLFEIHKLEKKLTGDTKKEITDNSAKNHYSLELPLPLPTDPKSLDVIKDKIKKACHNKKDKPDVARKLLTLKEHGYTPKQILNIWPYSKGDFYNQLQKEPGISRMNLHFQPNKGQD